MVYELGLQVTFAVSLWILIDLYGARGLRARRVPIMCLAGSAALWASGEMLVRNAPGPSTWLLGRRVMLLGAMAMPVAWLWAAAAIGRADWYLRRPWLVPLAGVPLLACYVLLLGEGADILGTPQPLEEGPIYWVVATVGCGLVAVGAFHFLNAVDQRFGRERPWRVVVVAAACVVPLAGSLLHWLGAVPSDPTPILLGFSGVALRLSLLDSGIAAVLPLGQRNVLEQLRIGVILADLEGIVVDSNAAARALLGGKRLLGDNLFELAQEARAAEGRVIEVEQVPLRWRFGNVGFAALLTDRTEATRLERQLGERQRLESLGLLAGGVAHDFNNLLTGILNNAGVARDSLPSDHPAQKQIAEAIHGARLASHLTGQLLAYAGRGHFDTRPLDLSARVREVEPLVRSSLPKGVHLHLELGPDLPAIEGDPGQVQQVVMNLALNAAEAVQGEGTVTLRTGAADLDEDSRRRLVPGSRVRAGRHVLLEVSDSGCGMDGQTLERIFDPFFTSKPHGHGLGLAATLGIVHAHGGALSVDSRPGAGTRIRVFFPSSERPAAEARPTPRLSPEGRGTVLVVDDEDYVLESVGLVLERLGYDVLCAADGERALELFDERGGDVDVVLLDVTMPGMGGAETFRALRERRPDVKVILSSGYDEADASNRFAHAGLAAFLPKPYDPDELAAKVKEVLDGDAPAQGGDAPA